MMRTVIDVMRGEGPPSAARRSAERLSEAGTSWSKFIYGRAHPLPRPRIVNVVLRRPVRREGGVAVQLASRLREEAKSREIALLYPGVLESDRGAWPMTSMHVHGAAHIIEGAFDDTVASLPMEPAVIVVHDLSLISSDAHAMSLDERRVEVARRLIERARAVVFPSAHLRDTYASYFPSMRARVIAPGIEPSAIRVDALSDRVAVVGSIKRHKGGALVPELVRSAPDAQWFVFGGGASDLLRAIRNERSAHVHGYYRAGTLQQLLVRHRIAIAVLPSIVPESFSLTLSECWSAGVPVVAFDHGAIAARIREHGGGVLAPLDEGAAGLARALQSARNSPPAVTARVPTSVDAAEEHLRLYAELGIL